MVNVRAVGWAHNSLFFSFQVYFWKAPSGQTPHNAEFKATIDTSTTLHLQPYTSYRFQVVAYNSIGDGPASNVVGPLTTPASSTFVTENLK